MTYCLGIKVRDGLVCLSDGRITSGSQVTNARKVSLHGRDGPQICIMTSGLRSLRDKALAYFDRSLRRDRSQGFASLLDAVNGYARCLRKVASEDREAPQASKLDMLTFAAADRRWREVHYDYEDLSAQRTWWNEHFTKLAGQMPDGPWLDRLLPQDAGPRLAVISED
jgi:hypothetical protein